MKSYWKFSYRGNGCIVHFRRVEEDFRTHYEVTHETTEVNVDLEDWLQGGFPSALLYYVIEHEGQTTQFLVTKIYGQDFNEFSYHETQICVSKLIQNFEKNKVIRLKPEEGLLFILHCHCPYADR